MEERQNSPNSEKKDQDETKQPSSATRNENESSQLPVFLPGTYVVQVPKDQIYRVPPPENAIMLAERGKNKQNRRSSCCFCSCLSCIFILCRGKKSG
ncbi:hypothetical protein CDL12_07977 [Handroanthus impetiginosus]|uniref:Uncharacterized protein n=1 Tax=Handroanthus impetiginosus TaxID=429701 RepID=A0A2G9HP94_9LAMI|nr:hypothetical protein CDL12_07977 [Handroanthus impetiginosus]